MITFASKTELAVLAFTPVRLLPLEALIGATRLEPRSHVVSLRNLMPRASGLASRVAHYDDSQ